MAAKEVSDQEFKAEVLDSDTPVLVDFWAPWCHPCKGMSSILDELAQEYGEKIKVVKVNVDENKEHASNYGIRNIPNFLVIKGGELKEQLVGAVAKQELVNAIDKVV